MSHPAAVTSFGLRLASGKSSLSSGRRKESLTKTFTGRPSVAGSCWKYKKKQCRTSMAGACVQNGPWSNPKVALRWSPVKRKRKQGRPKNNVAANRDVWKSHGEKHKMQRMTGHNAGRLWKSYVPPARKRISEVKWSEVKSWLLKSSSVHCSAQLWAEIRPQLSRYALFLCN